MLAIVLFFSTTVHSVDICFAAAALVRRLMPNGVDVVRGATPPVMANFAAYLSDKT